MQLIIGLVIGFVLVAMYPEIGSEVQDLIDAVRNI